jgi:hypothetical protein
MKKVCWYAMGCNGARLKSREGWLDIPENRHLYLSLKKGNVIEVPDDVANMLVNDWNCGIEFEQESKSFPDNPIVKETKEKPKKKSYKRKFKDEI